MSRLFHILSIFNKAATRACLWFAATGLVAMTAIIGWQVYARYVLNDTPHWSEQFCLLLMIYYILIAAAAGVREKTHIGLQFVKDALPEKAGRVFEVLIFFIVGLFGLGMVWYGGQMAASTWTHIIPTLWGMSKGMGYLPFPIAGVLFVLFSLEHLLAAIMGLKVEPAWN